MRNQIILLVFLVIGNIYVPVDAKQNSHRIVGGSSAFIQQYPYMANMQLLRYGIVWSQECGGTLVTTRTILSAAHCYAYYRDVTDPSWFWRVRLGSSFSNYGGSIHQISRLILHEDYDRPRLNNDVAIVVLSDPAVLSDNVGTVSIAGIDYNLPDGTNVVAAGWGTLLSGGPPSDQLQHVEIDTINQDLCVHRYAYLKSLPENSHWPDVTPGMLCAGILNIGGKDTCQGDSGGPLVHLNPVGHVVIGVTSWGFGCGDDFFPGVSARVSFYADWIVRNGSV